MWTLLLGFLGGGNKVDAVKNIAKFAMIAIVVGSIWYKISSQQDLIEDQATAMTVLESNNKVLSGKVDGLISINESNEKIISIMKANEDFLNDLEKKYEKSQAQEAGKEKSKKDAVRLLVGDQPKTITPTLASALNALKEPVNETK